MTLTADPYPAELAALDDTPAIVPSQDAVANRLIATLARLAQAVEMNTLALMDRPVGAQAPQVTSAPTLAALPPVQGIPQGACPIHNVPWKTVPAGVSKKTGQPYSAFQACSVAGCDQRPPR